MAENDVVKRNRKTIDGLSDYRHVDQGSPGSGYGVSTFSTQFED